jgi:hypothetical protein
VETDRPTRRRIARRIGLVALLLIGAAVFGSRWATQPASWPPELDRPRSVEFSNADQLTAADGALLDDVITEIALADPVVIGLLGGEPWPNPTISPAYWVHDGPPARRALIGGSFRLSLDNASYRGPWPEAGCTGGRNRGKVRNVTAQGLREVYITVDLTFGRVTHVTIPPTFGTTSNETVRPSIEYGDELPDAPWYTGSCPRFSFGD